MRIAIREQLAALVIIAVLVALAIVSIPTWLFVNNFVSNVESDGLALTASLKAARISSEIDLVQTTCESVASRILIQQAFSSFYAGNHSDSNWALAENDMQSALGSAGFTTLFQSRLYSRNTSGNATGLLNVTGHDIGPIKLPYAYPNGSDVYLGDIDLGYPPTLYPNITYNDTGVPSTVDNTTNAYTASAFPGVRLTNNGGLLLGPVIINSTFALISLTVPVRQNANQFLLGYMTIVASASSLIDIQSSPEGLGNTGVVLMIGPNTQWNRFNGTDPASNSTFVPANRTAFGNKDVHFILPPLEAKNGDDRHSSHDYDSGSYSETFKVSAYPPVLDMFADQINTVNNATATLSTKNEQGYHVAVGYARPQSTLVTWAVLVEQDYSEAYQPIATLRKILLGCVFGTAGLVLLLVFPCAHLSVRPIRLLKDATEKSITPPGYDLDDESPGSGTKSSRSRLSEKEWMQRLRKMVDGLRKKKPPSAGRGGSSSSESHAVFKIPGRVPERKHFITDELTELTGTFNAMSVELFKQYESLDEKVAERTRELEISKKAAEAANKSKTEFIANISHELKTPLNGIMGMCAVCMEEDDIGRIKQSLKTLYKSGDLLLHLLEDVLSFSKNQIGHQISLEEREFRLGDIRSQVIAIFDKQVREGGITLHVDYVGNDDAMATATATATANGSTTSPERNGNGTSIDRRLLPALGPQGVGRLKDMCLWGDQHRILQVIINLVNNSIKFTPSNGKVDMRIRCVGEVDQAAEVSRTSSFSKTDSHRNGRSRNRMGSSSIHSQANGGTSGVNTSGGGSISTGTGTTTTLYKGTSSGTAIAINPLDPTVATKLYYVRERSPTPPPPGAKTLLFEFEVQDTGPGIPLHMQEKVFEPFVQGDLGLSKKFGGTGLGLSICQQLATLMGGTITLKSTPGEGSTFTMRIPLKYTKDRPSSTASSSMKSRAPSVSSADGDHRRNSLHKMGGVGGGGGEAGSKSSKLQQQHQQQNQQQNQQQAPPVLDKQARLVGLSQPFFVAPPPPAGSGLNHHHHLHHGKAASPADQLAALNLAAIANKAAGGQGRVRVLVADDNTTNIEVVSRMLKLEDIYDVTIAKDGQEAYDLVKANMEQNRLFDVIFMDIQMPNLDGLQSTRLIRKLGYSAPIVALTAFSEESNVKECMESGMDEFLSKPIRRPALKQVLQKFATIIEEPETTTPPLPTPPPPSSQPPPPTAPPTTTSTVSSTSTTANGSSVCSSGTSPGTVVNAP